jgi:flagellar basal body P-ring protein FlgI
VVVLNERTGTIVMGGDVKIAKVMISHDGLSLAVGVAEISKEKKSR